MNYTDIFHNLAEAMFIVEDGIIVNCNSSFAQLFGFSDPSEIRSRNQLELFPEFQPDGSLSAEKITNYNQRVLDTGSLNYDWVFINQEGKSFNGQVSLSVLQAEGLSFICLVTNIGKSKTDVEQLIEENSRLNEAQRIAKIGSWHLDLIKNRLSWSDEIFALFEIDPKKFGASYEAFIETIHPDDREKVDKAYQDSLKNRKPYKIDHRLIFPDGRIKYVREQCESTFDEVGNPLFSQGTVQDISEQVEAEKKIQLYASAIENSQEAILITDKFNNIVAINSALVELTGYSEAELLGQNPRLLSSGQTPREVYDDMWLEINTSGYWQGELIDQKKDGTIYPKWLSVTAIKDENGNITNYAGSFYDISDKKLQEEKIKFLAHNDTLTGLSNRFSLEDRLGQALSQSIRSGHKIAVLFIDMDRFKSINDSLGHQVGDELLKQIAKRLSICSRRASDIIARIGGDEFVVVLTDIDDVTAVALIATTINYTLSQPYEYEAHILHTSPSIGISMFPSDSRDADELLRNADIAMYHAKEKGRNNYQFYNDSMNSEVEEALFIEHGLRTAIENDELELYFQPQLSAGSNRIVGAEALIRWKHPDKGFIRPDKFIPIAEDSGQIHRIGSWVIEQACCHLSNWINNGFDNFTVAVNVSAHQLKEEGFIKTIKSNLEKYQLKPEKLEIEITESVAMADPEVAIKKMAQLKDLGLSLSIDDFGTGYSSLAYLKMFPIKTLKLDQTFVRNIGEDINDEAICMATISLAHSMCLEVVAEGVETDNQREFLLDKGCDILQGYLFSRPLSADKFTEYLKQISLEIRN